MGTNYVMIVSEFLKHFFIPADLQVVNIILIDRKITQKWCKLMYWISIFFPEKLLQNHYIDVAPVVEVGRIWCTIGKTQPQYENMHTREQSVPSFCSRCGPPAPHPPHPTPTSTPTLSHNILFMSKDPGNTTSVSALIYTMNTRGRRIYIHLKMALYSTNILHHMKTQWRILYVQIFLEAGGSFLQWFWHYLNCIFDLSKHGFNDCCLKCAWFGERRYHSSGKAKEGEAMRGIALDLWHSAFFTWMVHK